MSLEPHAFTHNLRERNLVSFLWMSRAKRIDMLGFESLDLTECLFSILIIRIYTVEKESENNSQDIA